MGCKGEPLIKMAKIYGLFGAMSGKVADVVMSVRNGQQIVRKYQPIVSNPKTANQYTTRARFKLMSQLSAIFSAVIAIPRVGGVSPRNMFTKVNFPFTSFANDQAEIDMTRLQLTKSSVGMLPITANRYEDRIAVSLTADSANLLEADKVVYIMAAYGSDDKLRLVTSIIIPNPGVNGRFEATLPLVNNAVEIYAYSIRENSDTARTIFGNVEGVAASHIARLIVDRTLTEQDITLSETVNVHLTTTNRDGGDDDKKKTQTKK